MQPEETTRILSVPCPPCLSRPNIRPTGPPSALLRSRRKPTYNTWAAELDAVAATLAPRFERAEPRKRVLAYLTGLLSTAERKNGWQLAELAGEATPDGMQSAS